MKLHRLRISAIGPFPGEHTVDFDALGVSGLFLLTGPTGSGKSTLLDAIEFALYGTAGGAMKERLPSGHADPGARPRVELVFSNHRGVYRIERSPEYQRPKARGDGLTTEKSRASLIRLTTVEDLDAPGDPVSAHVQDVGQAIADIVGLTRDQFTQTVILPQGKFARFLTSSPEDRRTVLQDVFGTHLYEEAEAALRQRAAQVRSELEQASQEVAAEWYALVSTTRAVAERAGIHITDPSADEITQASAMLVGAAVREEETSRAQAAKAREVASLATSAVGNAHLHASRLDRLESAQERLAALHKAAGEIAAAEQRVARADQAAAVAAPVARATEAAQRSEGANRTREAALAECRELGLPPTRDIGELRESLLDAKRVSAALTDALGAEKELGRLRADSEQLAATITGKKADRVVIADGLAAVPARKQALQSERREHEQAAADLASATAAREVALARADTARSLAGAEAEAQRTEALRLEAAREAAQAQNHVHQIHLEWISSIAGEVAQELTPGQPCPVCGNTHHPEPAVRPEGAPSRADVADARMAAERADGTAVTAATKAAAAVSRVEALRRQLGGHDPARAEADLEGLEARVARAREAGNRITELNSALELIDHEAEATRAAERELAEAIAELESRAAVLSSTIAGTQRQVDSARGRYPTVLAAAGAAEQRVRALAAAEVAALDADAAARRRQEAEAELNEAIARYGFASAQAVRDALLEESEAEQLRGRVNAHRESLISAQATVADPELAGLGPRPDVPALEAAANAAEVAAVAADEASGSAHTVAESARESQHRLALALRTQSQALAEAAPILAMADAASGKNPRHTTLSSYVLLRRFEEVLAAANRRLAVMSEDRYQLVRSETREAGQSARKLGLAVEVEDHELGTRRSPHTLSGGETFYTSLSLALGLADTVTDEAGGIDLGTLFVDEGFGSLDSDALENVLAVLTGLSSGGRSVGIVSHVSELRSRIPEQVVVRRLPSGGSTLTVEA